MGKLAAECGIDSLVCIGEDAKNIYDAYLAAGGKKARYYLRREDFTQDVAETVGRGDVVLVKASHSMEFYEIVKLLKALK